MIEACSGSGAAVSTVPAGGLVPAARVAADRTRPAGVAGDSPGGHGIAADCGEPWPAEACTLAETRADTFTQATELHRELGNKKAEIQRAESLLGVATDAVIEARGQTSRTQSVAEQCIGAALQADA